MAAESDPVEQQPEVSPAPPVPDGLPVPEPLAAPEPPAPAWVPVTNLVQLYGGWEEYARDAASKGGEGWRVVAAVETDERAGFWRGILLWWFALVWRPPRRWLVTYTREAR